MLKNQYGQIKERYISGTGEWYSPVPEIIITICRIFVDASPWKWYPGRFFFIRYLLDLICHIFVDAVGGPWICLQCDFSRPNLSIFVDAIGSLMIFLDLICHIFVRYSRWTLSGKHSSTRAATAAAYWWSQSYNRKCTRMNIQKEMYK